jgi:hypothetical protein
MGDVVNFTNSTMVNPDGTLNEEGKEKALRHLSKCVKVMEKKIEDKELDGALVLLFKDGNMVEDIMAGNIKSTSLVFTLEFIKAQVIAGAENSIEEVTDDD